MSQTAMLAKQRKYNVKQEGLLLDIFADIMILSIEDLKVFQERQSLYGLSQHDTFTLIDYFKKQGYNIIEVVCYEKCFR